jgi:fibronectin type 3 domain-containing protein
MKRNMMRNALFILVLMILVSIAHAQKKQPLRATATPHNNALSWMWSQGTGDPATGFHVWKSSTSGGYGTSPYATVSSPTTLTYTDSAVSGGQTNYYVITAFNSAGDSTRSNEVTCTTPFSVPMAPTSATGVSQ